jgi:hypothetical protein
VWFRRVYAKFTPRGHKKPGTMAGRCLIRWGLSCRLVMAAGNLAMVRPVDRWHIRLWRVGSSPAQAWSVGVAPLPANRLPMPIISFVTCDLNKKRQRE